MVVHPPPHLSISPRQGFLVFSRQKFKLSILLFSVFLHLSAWPRLSQIWSNLREAGRECPTFYKVALTTIMLTCCSKMVTKLTTQGCNNVFID